MKFLIAAKVILPALILTTLTTPALAVPLVIGHRGADTPTVPESTGQAYRYAAPNAGMLEADVQWTKDSSDADTVGTMIIFHDATLDRTTNCTGEVKDRLWTYIRDNCRTDLGGQPVLKLIDLVAYARSIGKPILFHMKVNMSSAQAKQFWKAAKIAPAGSLAAGSKSRVPGIQLVKKSDALDSGYRLRYGYETAGNPSASYVKAVGPYLVINFRADGASSSRLSYYKSNGITIYLWTGKTEADYATMNAKKPHGVIVDDAPRYARWLASR